MIEAVALGVRGVLIPEAAFHTAAVEAAAGVFERIGICSDSFRRTAYQKLAQQGARALFSRTLHELGRRVDGETQRQAVLAARRAAPRPRPDRTRVRAFVRGLSTSFRIYLLDWGPFDALEHALRTLDIADVVERSVWTDRLGRDAAPPSTLAFRWLLERCDLRPRDCLYVAGSPLLWNAAKSAGYHVWPRHASDVGGDGVDLERLLDALDADDCTWT